MCTKATLEITSVSEHTYDDSYGDHCRYGVHVHVYSSLYGRMSHFAIASSIRAATVQACNGINRTIRALSQ